MNIKKGFTLIELLMYITIGTILIGNTLFFASYIQTICNKQLKPLQNSIQWYSALDIITNDMKLVTDWTDAQDHGIWKIDAESIQWHVVNNRLIRCKGTYNSSKKKWVHRRPAVVASDVQQCTFNYSTHANSIKKVTVQLTCDQNRVPMVLIKKVVL